MKKGQWSEEEIKTLRTMAAAGKSKTLIALRLRRTAHAVSDQARALGIKFAANGKRRGRGIISVGQFQSR